MFDSERTTTSTTPTSEGEDREITTRPSPSRVLEIVEPRHSVINSKRAAPITAMFTNYPKAPVNAFNSPSPSEYKEISNPIFSSEKEVTEDTSSQDPAVELASARRVSVAPTASSMDEATTAGSAHILEPEHEVATVSDLSQDDRIPLGSPQGVMLAAAASARRKRSVHLSGILPSARQGNYENDEAFRTQEEEPAELAKQVVSVSPIPGGVTDSSSPLATADFRSPPFSPRPLSPSGTVPWLSFSPTIRCAPEEGIPSPKMTAAPPPSRKSSIIDALRSNPPESSDSNLKRAMTTPAKRTARFGPGPLDIKETKPHQWPKVTSTPFPKIVDAQFQKESVRSNVSRLREKLPVGRGDVPPLRKPQRPGIKGPGRGRSLFKRADQFIAGPEYKDVDESNGIEVILALYNKDNPVPRLGKVTIPTISENVPPNTNLTEVISPSEKAREVAKSQEVCSEAVKEYTWLRGPMKRWLAARGLKGTYVVGYQDLSDLVKGVSKSSSMKLPLTPFRNRRSFHANTEELGLDVFAHDRDGLLRQLDFVSTVDRERRGSSLSNADGTLKHAIVFVEGWHAWRILTAFAIIKLAALAAMLLWIFLGKGGGRFAGGLGGLIGSPYQEDINFQGAGGRVESGVAIGLITLLLGWTGIAAWIGASWLAM